MLSTLYFFLRLTLTQLRVFIVLVCTMINEVNGYYFSSSFRPYYKENKNMNSINSSRSLSLSLSLFCMCVTCNQISQRSRTFQVKLDDSLDRKLMETLMEQLERIEVSIEPYAERGLLEQWQLCIGEIVRQQQQQQQTGEFITQVEWEAIKVSARSHVWHTSSLTRPVHWARARVSKISTTSTKYKAANTNINTHTHEFYLYTHTGTGTGATATTNDQYCPIIFDGWRCWPATRAGDTAYVSCPSNQPGFSAERKF